jgi:hypothetical protein
MPNAMCYMSSVICQVLCAICQTPYARLQYAKCYDHLIIYMYIYYPAMTLHIIITEKRLLLYHYGFNLYLRSQVFQFVSISDYYVISWVTCISVCWHIMASIKISVCRHIMASIKISISPFILVCQCITTFYNHFGHRQFWLSNISRHRSQS